MKEKLTAFIHDLILYDYLLFGGVFLLFILLIILTILLRRNTLISVILLFLAFIILFAGPTFGYIQMHQFLYKNSVELTSQQRLTFTQAVVVKGRITNESKFDFTSCKITASAYKVSGNIIKDFIFPFNPFKKMSILQENVKKGEVKDFKIIIEPFTYSKEYNISITAKCKG